MRKLPSDPQNDFSGIKKDVHEVLYLLLWCNIRIENQVLQALKSLCGCHGCLGRVEAAASDINVDISAPIAPNISFFFRD